MCTIYIFLFRQLSLSPLIFGKAIRTILFSLYFGNAIGTNQFPQFFSLYFDNIITTNQVKKIRICVLYIFLFRQLSLSPPIFNKAIRTIFFSIYFSNAIATNPFHKFFFPLFWQCHCHKLIATFFSPLFRQCHCYKSIATNQLSLFSPYFGNAIATNP